MTWLRRFWSRPDEAERREAVDEKVAKAVDAADEAQTAVGEAQHAVRDYWREADEQAAARYRAAQLAMKAKR